MSTRLVTAIVLILSVFGVLFGETTKEGDVPVRIYFHCDLKGNWDWDSEGEGGNRGFRSLLDKERKEWGQMGGSVLFLGVGQTLRKNPTDRTDLEGLQQMGYDLLRPQAKEIEALESLGFAKTLPLFSLSSPPKKIKTNGVRMEFHNLGNAPSWRAEFTDMIFALETRGEEVDWDVREWNQFLESSQSNPEIPVFLLSNTSRDKKGFFHRSGITYLSCPQDFAEMGKLDLLFRGRRLIRQNQEVFYWNHKKRNQNWKSPYSP